MFQIIDVTKIQIFKFQFVNMEENNQTIITLGSEALKKIIALMFQPQKQIGKQLIKTEYPINHMIPDFFTKDIQCYQFPKTSPSSDSSSSPSNSFVRFLIPLKTNAHSRLPFERLTSKQIRIGRIIQLMDSLAGLSIIKYTNLQFNSNKKKDFTIVTACIDHIFIEDSMTCEDDLIVQSYVNFVGSTSAEVEVNLIQSNVLKASAFFTMVTRDPNNTGKGGKGQLMPSLDFNNEVQKDRCLSRQQRGKVWRTARLERAKKSLQNTIPTSQQIGVLHQFFMKSKSNGCISMSSTSTHSSMFMHSQYRNMNNKIFGGFLMRQMLQTAWFAGQKMFEDSQIKIQRIQDVFFIQPVQIGEGIQIKSQAVYSHNSYIVIKTQAYKLNFRDNSRKKACQLYATFSDCHNKKLLQIYPESYAEGVEYLMGRRVLTRFQQTLSDLHQSEKKLQKQ